LLRLEKTPGPSRSVSCCLAHFARQREFPSFFDATCISVVFFDSNLLKFGHKAFLYFLYLFTAVLLYMMMFLVLIEAVITSIRSLELFRRMIGEPASLSPLDRCTVDSFVSFRQSQFDDRTSCFGG
jgi:hypothetical protein